MVDKLRSVHNFKKGSRLTRDRMQKMSWKMSSDKQRKDSPESGLALEERVTTKKPSMYKVLLHNDDFTTMEFVVSILSSVFRRSPEAVSYTHLTLPTILRV